MASNTAQPQAQVPNERLVGKIKLIFFCWDSLMRDAQLGERACTDHDEADERDLVDHELCQFLSDAFRTPVDEVLSVRSVYLARLQVRQGLETFHLY